jgi:hypothetical protein
LFICGCGWASLDACINNIALAAFKHFNTLIHTSLWETVLSKLGSQLLMDLYLFIPSDAKNTTACCLSFVQPSSEVVIFTLCSLGKNKLQLNHTCSMSLHVTLSYSMTRSHLCCQSCNKNIPILLLLFKSPLYFLWISVKATSLV